MQTLNEARNGAFFPSVYWGERGDWLLAYASGEPSDSVTRANMKAFQAALPDGSYEVETFKGPLSGCSSEYLLIDPARQDAIDIADRIIAGLEDYPVIDDEALSEVETDEAIESCAMACDLAGSSVEREAAAEYIYRYAMDDGSRDSYDFWPTPREVFFGYLRFRRAVRGRECDYGIAC